MRASIRMTLAAAAASALALGSLALGIAPASAEITPGYCPITSDEGVTVSSGGGLWWNVCLDAGATEDASTPHKTDAFDTIGQLYLNYADPGARVELHADFPALVEEFAGGEVHITWTDFDVPFTDTDLVDVTVVRHIKGTTQEWIFTVNDSDDGTVRSDVTIAALGNLGSDGNADFDFDVSTVIAYGDSRDPIIVARPSASTSSSISMNFGTPDGVMFTTLGSSMSLFIGLVDYGCDNYEDAIDYAIDDLGNDIESHYGETLVTPGTVSCMTAASPIHLTTGAAFNVPVNVTFGPAFDFSQGGELVDWYDNIYEWTDWVESDQNLPGVTPKLAITGTAPNEPGTYYMYVYGISNVNDVGDQALVVIIVDPPMLAATGSGLSPIAVGGALSLLFAGALTLGVLRRRRSQV